MWLCAFRIPDGSQVCCDSYHAYNVTYIYYTIVLYIYWGQVCYVCQRAISWDRCSLIGLPVVMSVEVVLVLPLFSLEQSSSKMRSYSFCQKAVRPFWNRKFEFRVHNIPPVISILSRTNVIHHILTLCSSSINSFIIHTFKPK